MIDRVVPRAAAFFSDRVQVLALLVVLCVVAILLLNSQSAASYPSYALALLMVASVRHWNDVFATPLIWLVMLLLAYLCLSSAWSDPLQWRPAAGILSRAVLVFCFVVAMGECQIRGQVQLWLGRMLAVSGGISAVAAIVVYLADTPPDGRLAGLGQLDNPVVLGLIFAAVVVILMETVMADPSRFWRAVAGGCMPIAIAAIVLSGSRNAWLGTTVGLVVLVVANLNPVRTRLLGWLIGIFLALAVVALVFISGEGRELLLPRGDSFRLDIWRTVFREVQSQNPIFGLGILTPDQVTVGERTFQHPHNMYLAIFFQGGWLGLSLFLLLVVGSVRILLANYELRQAKLAMALLALSLTSYFLDGHELIDKVGESWILFWLAIGISVGLSWSQSLRAP